MTIAAVTLLVTMTASVLVRWQGPALARSTPPRFAVPIIALAALITAAASGLALTWYAIGFLAGLTDPGLEGDWSPMVVRNLIPIPAWLGISALVVLTVALVSGAVRVVRIAVALARSDRFCRRLPGHDRVVYLDDSVEAVTVAGLTGRVLIGKQLLTTLTDPERRVVIEHELSHLRRRHHLYVHAVDIAIGANPLLAPLASTVRLGVERWADEDSARRVGDRELTALTLARVALAVHQAGPARVVQPPVPVLAMAAGQVSVRVAALLDPPVGPRPTRIVAVALAVLAAGALGLDVLLNLHQVIELAQFPLSLHHRG